MKQLQHKAPVTIGLSALLALGLVGCTGDKDSPGSEGSSTSSSASGSPSPSASFTGSDQSSVVLSAALPAVRGTSKGTVDKFAATLNVAEVRATAAGTRLTFWFTGTDTQLVKRGERSWPSMPTLKDPAGKKVYSPLTFTNEQGDTVCLCTDAAYVRGVPQPRTVLYPALPAGVTTVQVQLAGFAKPIPVPVTR